MNPIALNSQSLSEFPFTASPARSPCGTPKKETSFGPGLARATSVFGADAAAALARHEREQKGFAAKRERLVIFAVD